MIKTRTMVKRRKKEDNDKDGDNSEEKEKEDNAKDEDNGEEKEKGRQ